MIVIFSIALTCQKIMKSLNNISVILIPQKWIKVIVIPQAVAKPEISTSGGAIYIICNIK